MFFMMPFNFSSTSSNVHDRCIAFWLISNPETATPPALLALPGAERVSQRLDSRHGLAIGLLVNERPRDTVHRRLKPPADWIARRH